MAGGGFATHFAGVGTALARTLGTAGFEPSGAASLTALRAWVSTPRAGDPPSADEATRLLDAAQASPAMTAVERQRVAALKMLRHVYLAQQRGGQTAWGVSLPLDFTDWPAAALGAGSADAVKTLLRSSNERFSSTDIGNLSGGTSSALRWCQKA